MNKEEEKGKEIIKETFNPASVKPKELSKRDAEIVEQNKRPIEDVIKQLGFKPLQRNVLVSCIPDENPESPLYLVGPNGGMKADKDSDGKQFKVRVLAVAFNSQYKDVLKIGDEITILAGQSGIINGIHVSTVRDHEVDGVFTK